MNLFDKFAIALPVADFLAKYGSPAHQARWKTTLDAIQLNDAQKHLLGSFKRDMNVLVLAGAWCGDCSGQCPIFDRFAEAAPTLKIRYLDNADHEDVQEVLSINGGKRVPVAVFFSEDGFEVLRYGERPLSKYRQMMKDSAGDSCPTGIGTSKDPLLVQVIQDWLNEFERVQWILRLSGRLRKMHGD
ncbi:MAG: thiol reductase thioredoxin [Gemmataceae bacterium]|nr:thiol reductase thioredoxin [Gemmataceae bacterium]